MGDFHLQAKIVVLGDAKSGKTSLIHNIDPQTKVGHYDSTFINEDIIFSVVEFPLNELIDIDKQTKKTVTKTNPKDMDESTVFLKIWEHSKTVSEEEEELAFRGALICIITVDLRSPESAKHAFSKWLVLKEKHMNECFLFVVGTFLDYSTHRRVEIAQMCKACAQKEAIYVEVSNFDGSNIILLRKLLAQRIQYMINVRETISNSNEIYRKDEEELNNNMDGDGRVDKLNALEGPLNTPFYESDLLHDSVGSILASCLNIHYWPGYHEEEAELMGIGRKLTDYLDKLASDPKSLPKHPEENFLKENRPPTLTEKGYSLYDGYDNSGIDAGGGATLDVEDLKNVFEIMGFSLPQSLTRSGMSESPFGALIGEASVTSSARDRSESIPSNADIHHSPSHHKLNNAGNSNTSPSRRGSVSTSASVNGSHNTRQQQQGSGVNTSSDDKQPIRMKIKLQDGSTAYLNLYQEYEVSLQVEAFLIQYSMEEDLESRDKLIAAATALLNKNQGEHKRVVKASANSSSNTDIDSHSATGVGKEKPVLTSHDDTSHHHQPQAPLLTSNARVVSKKCRVRIQLPDIHHNRSIDIVLKPGEDLTKVAEKIAVQYGLSIGYQQKVYDQLRTAFPDSHAND